MCVTTILQPILYYFNIPHTDVVGNSGQTPKKESTREMLSNNKSQGGHWRMQTQQDTGQPAAAAVLQCYSNNSFEAPMTSCSSYASHLLHLSLAQTHVFPAVPEPTLLQVSGLFSKDNSDHDSALLGWGKGKWLLKVDRMWSSESQSREGVWNAFMKSLRTPFECQECWSYFIKVENKGYVELAVEFTTYNTETNLVSKLTCSLLISKKDKTTAFMQ